MNVEIWHFPFSIWHTRKIKRREHSALSLNTAKGSVLPFTFCVDGKNSVDFTKSVPQIPNSREDT